MSKSTMAYFNCNCAITGKRKAQVNKFQGAVVYKPSCHSVVVLTQQRMSECLHSTEVLLCALWCLVWFLAGPPYTSAATDCLQAQDGNLSTPIKQARCGCQRAPAALKDIRRADVAGIRWRRRCVGSASPGHWRSQQNDCKVALIAITATTLLKIFKNNKKSTEISLPQPATS